MPARFLKHAALAFTLLSAPVLAQSFEEGAKAYEKGDFDSALENWRPLAEQGQAKAQFNLGLMYERGAGVDRSEAEAAHWLLLAAAQGHTAAQVSLATIYANGSDEVRNYAEAAKWFRTAAEHGNSEAETALGSLYNHGHGVKRDDKEAVRWFRLAAVQGYGPALTNLGYMFEQGQGVAKDQVKAHMYFNLGAAASADALANRDRVAKLLTPGQVQSARELARKCMESNYHACS